MRWLRRRSGRRDAGGAQATALTAPDTSCAESARLAHDPDDASLFAFLEQSLQGTVPTPPVREHAEAVTRTLALANADWPEQDAVRELLLLVEGNRRVLERTQRVLQGGLLRTMVPDLTAIRASRIVHAALRGSRGNAGRCEG